jgi:hypothetical protein
MEIPGRGGAWRRVEGESGQHLTYCLRRDAPMSETPSRDKAQARGTSSAPVRPARSAGQHAVARAQQSSTGHLNLPLIGTITFPPRNQLAFLAGLGALAVTGVIEWPIAAAVGVGHLLATSHSGDAVRDFGKGLEEV